MFPYLSIALLVIKGNQIKICIEFGTFAEKK